MNETPKRRSRLALLRKAAVEISFIVFLFYANLLMGDFTETRHIKSFAVAFRDIVTPTNFWIAVFSAVTGYLVFEFLRTRL